MRDEDKTRAQLLSEVELLRRRIAELEASKPGRGLTSDGQVEQAAAKERDRFQAILLATIECLPFEFFAIGMDGRYMLQNATLRAHYGDALGRFPEDYAPDDSTRQLWLNNNRRAFAGERIEGEAEAHIGGQTLHYYNIITPIRDADHLYGILGVNIDMTERKRAEEALKEAHAELERRVEQRTAELVQANEELTIFRKFAETSSQGFSMADLDGHLTYLNPAMCRMLGEKRPEDAVGKHLSSYFSEEVNRKGEEEIVPALNREGHWEGELPMLSGHGASIPTWHNTFLIRDERGNPLRIAVVITDITERKRNEEALRQSHDELRAIYENMADGLHILNLSTMRPVQANPALCRMTGYSEKEILLLSPADVHPPEELPRITERFQLFLEGRASGDTDLPLMRKDGSIFYADVTGTRIIYNGQPCVVCFFHDTTERRKAQEALERERGILGHLFRSSDHERQLIAYDIHDGLAQYLAGAIMQFDTFAHLRKTKPQEAEKAFEAGRTMLRQSHGEARRLISGVRPPILDEAGIVAAVSHLIYEQRQPGGPKIEFHSLVEFNRLVAIQENTIYRIVQEALTNACKYSQSERVRVEIVQQGDKVQLEVQDWGIGFDPDKVGENSFGLEGIRERTRLLGGSSTIESAPEKGTRIRIELPLAVRDEYE